MKYSFFELSASTIDTWLPLLIQQLYTLNRKITFVFENEPDMHTWDDLLWTYKQISFLPHTILLDHKAKQDELINVSILLTTFCEEAWLIERVRQNKHIFITYSPYVYEKLYRMNSDMLGVEHKNEPWSEQYRHIILKNPRSLSVEPVTLTRNIQGDDGSWKMVENVTI